LLVCYNPADYKLGQKMRPVQHHSLNDELGLGGHSWC